MNNNTSLKIVIAETSVILRSGLTAVLKRIPNLNVHPIEVSSVESLQNYIHTHPADIVIINPTFGGWFDLPAFKADHGKPGIKYIAMVCSVIDNLLKGASGQAVQNMNLMFGFPEDAGLRLKASAF